MSATIASIRPAAGVPQTLAGLVTDAADRHHGAALRHHAGGEWRDVSFAELESRTAELAAGLLALDVEPGDRVAIFSATCAEWTLCDLAALQVGATVVPIYHTSSPDEVEYLLGHSGASVALCETEELVARVRQAAPDARELRHVFCMRGGEATLDDVRMAGRDIDPEQVAARRAKVAPEDLCTIVYTSGTTGRPKGCMLTHANVLANMRMLDAAVEIEPGARVSRSSRLRMCSRG